MTKCQSAFTKKDLFWLTISETSIHDHLVPLLWAVAGYTLWQGKCAGAELPTSYGFGRKESREEGRKGCWDFSWWPTRQHIVFGGTFMMTPSKRPKLRFVKYAGLLGLVPQTMGTSVEEKKAQKKAAWKMNREEDVWFEMLGAASLGCLETN